MAQLQEPPLTVQLDLNCLRSLLNEFFDPLRTDDARADFYTVYRRESENFDRDYVGRFSQNLDTALLFAGLFSAVSATLVSVIQPQLQPDQNVVTVAYMQLLIHTLDGTLFPHANPNPPTSPPDPPSKIVVAQAILYASLATSLLAAFFAMLGKQWLNRYTRSHGGSIREKSQNRQRKLDALNNWRFHLIIESLPVMLQFALLLFGCSLSIYLWTVSHKIARVAIGFTSIGVALYAIFTIAALLSPTCPYQTPLSSGIRALARGASAFCRSVSGKLRSVIAPQGRGSYHPGFDGRNYSVSEDEERPQYRNVKLDERNFGEVTIDQKDYGDAHCVSWVFRSANDNDIVFYGAWFTVEMTLYPEIAGILSPDVLADHFLSSAFGRQMDSGRLESMGMIGMALASVLSIRLCMDPEREDLLDLSREIRHFTDWICSSEPMVPLGVTALGVILQNPKDQRVPSNIPGHLPSSQKLCLSRIVLQTVWRWRRADPTTTFDLKSISAFCDRLMSNGDHVILALKTNCFLIIAISLRVSADDPKKLFAPDTRDALSLAINIFNTQLRESIKNHTGSQIVTSILSAVTPLDPFQAVGNAELGFDWISEILRSGYSEDERHLMAIPAMRMVEGHLFSNPPYFEQPIWIHSFLHFLSLFEGRHIPGSSTCLRSIAHCILSSSESAHHSISILPLLTSTLSPTHPFQLRCSALKAFYRIASGWFSQSEVPDVDLPALLQAVGDPFQFTPDPLLPSGQHRGSMMIIVALIEFSSTDRWRGYLTKLAFTTCEELVSMQEGRELVLECLYEADTIWPEFLGTDRRVDAAIAHLRKLGHQRTADTLDRWAQATRRLCGGFDPLLSPISPYTYNERDDDQSTRLESSTAETIPDNLTNA